MIISCMELVPTLDNRQAMLEILQFVERGLRNNPWCNWCGIFEQVDKNHTILYMEQWESEQALYIHIRSSLYLPLLNAMDLARSKPKISFHEVRATRSIELIESLRKHGVDSAEYS